MQIGTTDPQGKGMKKSQLSGHEIKDWGHMSPTIDMEA